MDAMERSDYKENDMMKAHRSRVKKVNDSYDSAKGYSNTTEDPANPGDRVWGGPSTPPLTGNNSTKPAGKGKPGLSGVKAGEGKGEQD